MYRAIFFYFVVLITAQSPFASEQYATGYMPINRGNLQLFYWLFQHRDNSTIDAPLILWMQGGPGCSDITNALIDMGPFNLSLIHI